jgi:hypothetical protein
MPDVSRHMRQLALVLFVVAALPSRAFSDDLLGRIEGTYEVPSECTTINSKGEHESCGSHVMDRLRIQRLSERTAKFDLYSVQINGHQCEASGIADLKGESLIYLDPDSQDQNPGQGLRIQITSSALVLDYLRPVSMRPPFCGMRAYASRLRFPLSAKIQ